MTFYRDTSHLNTDIGGGVTIGSKSDRMCQGLVFSSAKIFNFARLQSCDVDTDEVLGSLDRKLISADTLMSGDAKRSSLTRKIADDGDNTLQIGQIKVAS